MSGPRRLNERIVLARIEGVGCTYVITTLEDVDRQYDVTALSGPAVEHVVTRTSFRDAVLYVLDEIDADIALQR